MSAFGDAFFVVENGSLRWAYAVGGIMTGTILAPDVSRYACTLKFNVCSSFRSNNFVAFLTCFSTLGPLPVGQATDSQ
jgi:hypothetical protein